MKRIQASILRSLALSALLLSGACTSDGTEPVEEMEDENRIHQAEEESADAELPSPEQASAEAAEGAEAMVDANTTGDVQQLATDQQLATSETTPLAEEPSEYQLKQAAIQALAETPGTDTAAPAAEAAPAPMESPALAGESAAESIPTLTDVVADSEATQPVDTVKKSKKGKKARSKKAEAAVAATPAPTGDGKIYIVQPGDTLGSISNLLYGTPGRWKELAERNGLAGKKYIFPGDAIQYAPDQSTAAFEAKWEGLSKVSLTVEKHDTLAKIATRVMGNASYWKVIWQWNQSSIPNPNKIAVGQSIQYIAPQELSAALSSGKNEKPAH